MKSYLLTDPARADVREILNHVASQSERRAEQLLDEFQTRFRDLADQPLLMGFVDDVYGTIYRVSPVRDYVIFYTLVADGVEVIRIIHGARDIDSMKPF